MFYTFSDSIFTGYNNPVHLQYDIT